MYNSSVAIRKEKKIITRKKGKNTMFVVDVFGSLVI